MKNGLIIDASLVHAKDPLASVIDPLAPAGKGSAEIVLEKMSGLSFEKVLLLPGAAPKDQQDFLSSLAEKYGALPVRTRNPVRNNADLYKELNALCREKGFGHIVLLYADSPLLDTAVLQKLFSLHTEGLAEYTFGDNFCEGLAPEVMSAGFLEKINGYEYKKPDILSRRVFDCMNADINRFFIDLEVAEFDFSVMRIELVASGKRNRSLLEKLLAHVRVTDDYKKIYQAVREHPEALYLSPRYAEIAITEKDNMECSFCPRSKASLHGLSMDFGLYAGILKELTAEYDDIIVEWGVRGEPLLHPEFFRFVEHTMNTPGIFNLIIGSNGLLFDRKVTEKLSQYPAEKLTVVFGLDSIRPDTFRQLRKPENPEALSVIMDNIMGFTGFHPANRSRTFVQILKMKANNLEIEDFYRFWQEKGVNVIIQKFNSFLGLLEDQSVVDLTPLDRTPCWHLQRDLVVVADGSVPVCRQDIKKECVIGNLKEEGLSSIREKQKKYYLHNYRGDFGAFPMCRNCDEWYTYNF